MNVGMIFKLSPPGMENPEKTGTVTADELTLGGKLFQGRR
jgi:hypothetical protein